MNKSFYPFLFIVLAIFIAMAAPDLFADGMFMDGLFYAVISKNLAHGEGSFWFLHFTDTVFPVFHEHPPLVFGIQSIFFKIFGDSILVEKLFSFSTYIITGFLLLLIWQEITKKKFSEISWLPLLLWIFIPLVHWGAVSNMLENTMSVFVCLSVLFIIKSLSHKKYLYLSAAGLMLFCAFLSKGFTGLFPLSLPFWIFCFKRREIKTFLIDLLLLLVGLSLPLLLIYSFNHKGIESLEAYLNIQVLKSIQEIQTVNSRFFILGKLFTELLIPIGIVIVILIFGKREKPEKENQQWFFVLLALGLSGVLPIMVSLKQNGFYILCALPFFALALALLVAGPVKKWIANIALEGKGFKLFRRLSFLLLLVAFTIAVMQEGKIHQHKSLIHSVKTIAKFVPLHTVISAPAKLRDNWSMHGYFKRYADISVETQDDFKREYLFLTERDAVPSGYEQLPLRLTEFKLCRRRKN
jgi:4-amino-4-deoxy-L-arabinose transferase-like glycosyltransferase